MKDARGKCDHIPMDADTIRREALSLPPEQRAALAERLLSSLDFLSDAELG
jgi:hypothetical protein